MNKICNKCGIDDDENLFVKKENCCKQCRAKYNKEYKINNNNRSNYLSKYYEDNKDKILSGQKQYYQNNKDKILLRQKEYEDIHYENMNAYRKKYRDDHKEKQKIYCILNKDKLAIYHNKYMKNRNKIDPIFKLRGSCSRTINYALRGVKRGKSFLKYISYTMQELKGHLEKQFDSNMSWANYGSYWHIDHIYPQSLLPYSSMEDNNFKKCWSLDNLRPLEKIENIKK